MLHAPRRRKSILALISASTLLMSCGDGESCPPTGPPPFEDCLAGSTEPGCELPLTIGEGPLSTDVFPLFECSGLGPEWTAPICFSRNVVASGSNPVTFRDEGLYGYYFVLSMDPASGRARLCTEYSTDAYASGCPIGGEDWKCAVDGMVTIEADPPEGLEPLTELRAILPGGEMVHAIW